jgi:uncharacterized membrane protein
MGRLRHLWNHLSASYWFVPSVMMVGAANLALAMVWADVNLLGPPSDALWLYTGGPEGARAMLATIAGSVITVAGVGFSIAIVTLTQASSQFGPRLLRNFMRDRGNQVVLGTWVATFIYGVLVLRTVRGGEDGAFVPNYSVTVGVALSITSVAALVYFIHHVSFNLQAPQLVALVAREVPRSRERVYPGGLGTGAPAHPDAEQRLPADFERTARLVEAEHSGYLQAIDQAALMRAVETRNLRMRIPVRPGDYVARGRPLAFVTPGDVPESLAARLRRTFFLGAQPTDEQDPEFAIKQLVEIAVRSLSPGINDPFTAMHCVEWLGASVAEMARDPLPSPLRYDARGQLRVVTRAFSFSGLVDAAFDQVRQHASRDLAVTLRLLDTLSALAPGLSCEEQRRAVRRQARLAYQGAGGRLHVRDDEATLRGRYRAALAALGSGAA